MIARAPHPIFAGVWLVLDAAILGFNVWGDGWACLALGSVVLTYELAAVKHRSSLRTTWSEITTWYQQMLSKHRKPLVGWNTLVAIQAFNLGWLVYNAMTGLGAPWWAGLVVGGLLAKGQHGHWLNTPENG